MSSWHGLRTDGSVDDDDFDEDGLDLSTKNVDELYAVAAKIAPCDVDRQTLIVSLAVILRLTPAQLRERHAAAKRCTRSIVV